MNMKLEWDYSSLLLGDLDEKIREEGRVIEKKVLGFVSKWKERKDYLEEVAVLKEALDEYEDLIGSCGTSGNIGYYLFLRKMKDQGDAEILSKYNLVEETELKFSNMLNFFVLNISKIGEEKQKDFLDSEELVFYRHFLERMFRRGRFLLSEEVERVLSLKSGPAYDSWVDMLSSLLSSEERVVWTGEKEEVRNFSEIFSMISFVDSRVAESCAFAFNDILKNNLEVAVAQINAIFKDKKINDELRGYSRVDESRIVRDDIDFEFVDSLLEAVVSRFDISKRFYELKARLMGKDKIAYHERVTPYGDFDRKISYEEGVEIVNDSFLKMDKEFASIFKKFVENGDVDVYPAKGKRQGAFCSSGLKVHPSKILLNYMDRVQDVVILAHESGHGINNEFMRSGSSLDFGVPVAVAEVASNFAENITFSELLFRVHDDEERLVLMVSKLSDYISSIQRQVACYKFEMELHEEFRRRGGLSSDVIGKIFHKHMSSYMGDFVEYSLESNNWWTYWPHIRDYFYVYSYASGALIAAAISKKCGEDVTFVEKVKKFLSMGRKFSPRDAFGSLGIRLDKEFWNEGLDNIEEMLNDTWRLAEKLGKI